MAYTAIDDSGLFMNTVLYTGTGSTQAVTGVGFQPDMTWVKSRSNTAAHKLTDAVRGVTKELEPNSTAAEYTEVNGLTVFGADGFTIGSDPAYGGSGRTFAGWNWKAGTTTGITTDGNTTITPSGYSFNATSGFSCIAYTGNGTGNAKYPHGLGVAPAMVITKQLDSTNSWYVFQQKMSATPSNTEMYLNGTDAAPPSTGNGITPDTVNIELEGTSASTNGSGNTYIAYIFAEISGYSKIRKYIGNGNADGTFVYTGFSPAWVMIKRTTGAYPWMIFDNKRNTYNPADTSLFANATDADTTSSIYDTDFLSNGFKLRSSNSTIGGGGDPYIYMAFAEAPFVNSNGVPCNAR